MDRLISLQAAIYAADRADYTGLTVEDVKKVTDEVVKELKQLPSAQPETTHRIIAHHKSGTTMWYECEKCGREVEQYDKYCPCCGRRFE